MKDDALLALGLMFMFVAGLIALGLLNADGFMAFIGQVLYNFGLL